MSDKITPEQHYARFRLRREAGDYHAIFMHGCCYHFALALHKKYQLKLEYVPAERPADFVCDDPQLPGVGHCWAIKQGGRGIDINGAHPTTRLIEIYSESCRLAPISIEPEKLHECLNARKYLEDMNKEAFDLAFSIILKHERFAEARPLALDFIHGLGKEINS